MRHKVVQINISFNISTPSSYYNTFYNTSTLTYVTSYEFLINNGFPKTFSGYGNGLDLNFRFCMYDTRNMCMWTGIFNRRDNLGFGLGCWKQNISQNPNLYGCTMFV